MKRFGLAAVLMYAVASWADAPPSTLYYIGEATATADGNVQRHEYAIARTQDPAAGQITELAITFMGNGYKENSSTMQIRGNGFVMSESTGTVTGEGRLIGEAWAWKYLEGEFQVPRYRMRIVDFNLFTPNAILAHKDFYMRGADGKESLVNQEDAVLHVTDQATFEAKRKTLLGGG